MINLQNIKKQYGSKIIFNGDSFHLRPGERVGLVGANGMGKTTLMRIIVKEEEVDSGTVSIRKGARMGRLAQDLPDGEDSILERVIAGDPHFFQVKKSLEELQSDEAFHQADPEGWSHRFGDLQHEFEHLNGYEREPKARAILSGLGFKEEQMDRPVSVFSGGWRMRVELAQLLLQNPEALLLDEPTNHLDLRSVVWLESFLKTFEGAILLISHDRNFLDALVQRVAELDRGKLTAYAGNYSDYERLKEEREAQLEAAATNQQKRIAEIEKFIDRFRAKNTKATQVQSRIKLLNKIERVETATQNKKASFRFPQPERTGRIGIQLKSVDKSYGPLRVYQNFSVTLERGWKVALVGENGAGKSTLLKLMGGVLSPDKGTVELGHKVARAYFAQHQSESLDPNLTVLETLQSAGGKMLMGQLRGILGAFLFSGDDVFKKAGVLSGGERSRLSLARMLVNPASVLLLDEPTNHLDIPSCEVLAAALADYDGSIVAISHDRYFLDGVVNRVWEVDNGTIKEYVGNYSDYEWAKAREAEEAASAEAGKRLAAKNDGNAKKGKERKRQEAEARNKRHKLLKPLQARLKEVEKKLEQTMEEKGRLDEKLADAAIYEVGQKGKLLKVQESKREVEKSEKDLTTQWEKISTELETLVND